MMMREQGSKVCDASNLKMDKDGQNQKTYMLGVSQYLQIFSIG
jgi:hypothetical protein